MEMDTITPNITQQQLQVNPNVKIQTILHKMSNKIKTLKAAINQNI